MSNDCTGNDQRLLRVVRGDPTDEELAALAVVLAGTAGPVATGPVRVSGPSRWVRSARPGAGTAGLPAGRGAGAWRTSARPAGR